MSARASCIALVVTVAMLGGAACKTQKSADEQKKIDDLQSQLNDAKQQLAAKQAESQVAQPPAPAPVAVEPPPAPRGQGTAARTGTPKAGAAAAQSAGRVAAVPHQPPTTRHEPEQGNAPTGQQTDAEHQQKANALAEEQRRVNENQEQTNAQVQRQIEEMKPVEYTIPAGTVIPVRTTTELSTSSLATGSTFDAVLERDLVVDGTLLAAHGSHVTGVVASSDPGGRVKGVASLAVTLRSIAGRRDHLIRVKTDQHSVDAPKSTG